MSRKPRADAPRVCGEEKTPSQASRRLFLRAAACALGAAALAGCKADVWQAFLQRQLHELSPEEIKKVIARLQRTYKMKYGMDVKIGTEAPLPGVEFGYALDLSRCIGCRRCVYACVAENNQSRKPQIHWIRVLQMDKERGVNVFHSNLYYDPEQVPEEGHFYMPVQCQQCKNPPCVKVCPVRATWQEPDGITVVDYNWCIGCRYCMAACPYGSRSFNWLDPRPHIRQTNTDYPTRTKGVVEKCTFCDERLARGQLPACVEACDTKALVFGDLQDPNSGVRNLLRTNFVLRRKAELGTNPEIYYIV